MSYSILPCTNPLCIEVKLQNTTQNIPQMSGAVTECGRLYHRVRNSSIATIRVLAVNSTRRSWYVLCSIA